MSKPVVIIGAGPSGIECARTLSLAGVPVVVIDDNANPGGQYFRQLPSAFEASSDARLLREFERGRTLIASLKHHAIRYMPRTTAWMVPSPRVVAYAGEGGSGRIEASFLVLATGAHDKPVPFPGWTLPGVVSAGGALNLAKGQGQAPEGRVVVAGNGPLLLVVAATLATAGTRVTHVVECAPGRQAWPAIPGLLHAPGLLWKGLDYRRRLLASGTRFLTGWTVTEASGSDRVSDVRISPLRSDGKPDLQRSRSVDVDWLVTGFGLQPSGELAHHIGCAMRYEPARGGWIAQRSPELETTQPNVFAIGDGAGIGGVEVALAEGALAANVVLSRMSMAAPGLESARARLAALERFRNGLARLYRAPLPDLATASTVVCRCEEVSCDQLRCAMDEGAADLVMVKSALRLGMGRCQGRNCFTSAAVRLAERHGTGVGDYPLPRARGPIRPIRIGDLLHEPLPAAREPDSISLFERKQESVAK